MALLSSKIISQESLGKVFSQLTAANLRYFVCDYMPNPDATEEYSKALEKLALLIVKNRDT